MGQGPPLRLPEVLDERSGGRGGQRGLRQTERVQGRDPEMFSQRPGRHRRIEPLSIVRGGRHILHDYAGARIIGHE